MKHVYFQINLDIIDCDLRIELECSLMHEIDN